MLLNTFFLLSVWRPGAIWCHFFTFAMLVWDFCGLLTNQLAGIRIHVPQYQASDQKLASRFREVLRKIYYDHFNSYK